MNSRTALFSLTVAAWIGFAVQPAGASFHLMQVEQVIGATCGSVTKQAIQLRMRANGQNEISQASVWVRDAQGQNPLLLVDIPFDVANGTAGSRVLLATWSFHTHHGISPDVSIADFNRIPTSYLEAGKLTFEGDDGTIYWSLAWGGAAYTGPNLGATTNDPDGDFGPAFPEPLLNSHSRALLFNGAAGAPSSTNAADYVLTGNMPMFSTNTGGSVTLQDCVFGDGFETQLTAAWDAVVSDTPPPPSLRPD